MYNNFVIGFGFTPCQFDKQTTKDIELYILPCFQPPIANFKNKGNDNLSSLLEFPQKEPNNWLLHISLSNFYYLHSMIEKNPKKL